MTAAQWPKVSVVSTTYNQASYVREAFDGFIAQQTDFPVEIIVADDASTDSTPAIIQEYTNQYPHLFRPIFRPENLGYKANLIGAMSAARGEYVAWCEGDDYWLDPLKLSKQVDFLDRHPGTAVCFHPVRVIWEDGYAKDSEYPSIHLRGNLSIETLILVNFIQNASVMYRRLPHYDAAPAADACFDWYLHIQHALHGNIAMLPDTMAVYRRHLHGMFFDRFVDPAKFWLTQGAGHVATFDAMLDLFADDPLRKELVVWTAEWMLRQIATIPGPEGGTVLQDIIAEHPRLAMLVLERRWATTGRRLKTFKRGLTALAPTRKGLVDVWPPRRKPKRGVTEAAHSQPTV